MASRLRAMALALTVFGAVSPALLFAGQPPIAPQNPAASQLAEEVAFLDSTEEIKAAIVRLPLAAVFGLALAFRPRRRSQGERPASAPRGIDRQEGIVA